MDEQPPPTTPRRRGNTPPPEVLILTNSAALHSLRRPQLLSLCKEHGLKGSGKNVDLVARLLEEGQRLAESHASSAMLKEDVVPAQEELAEFGVQDGPATGSWRSKASMTASSSSSSIASTIHSAGTSLLRALTDHTGSTKTSVEEGRMPAKPVPTSTIPSIYPSLAEAFEQYPPQQPPASEPDSVMSDTESCEDGGIRLVSSRSTIHSTCNDAPLDTEDAPPVPALPESSHSVVSPAPTPAFIFGSPVDRACSPPPAFSFTMPGTLFSSTALAGDIAAQSAGDGKSAAELVMEEMNRRAAEARAVAGESGRTFGTMASGASSANKPTVSPSKGSKEAFDNAHKRGFAQMTSITDHWAAKRLHPSTSSNNLAAISRSTSSRALASSSTAPPEEERAPKRLKPSTSKPSGLNRLPSSSSSKKLVDGLRAAGWSAAPQHLNAVSLAASVRSGRAAGEKGKSKEMREDLKPAAEREREQKKRQLELAKARRKSQAASGLGVKKRRPSLVVGPQPTGSSASRFLKSTFKKLAPSLASTSTSAAPAKPAPSFLSRRLPLSTSVSNLASSTASTSSRATLHVTAASPNGSLKRQPGWKKFDLQESLRRPMPWKAGSSSLAGKVEASAPGPKRAPSLSRQPSARVANTSLLGAVKPDTTSAEQPAPLAVVEEAPTAPASPSHSSAVEPADDPLDIVAKLAALPSAPSTIFGATPAASFPPQPFQPLTNVPLTSTSNAPPSTITSHKPSYAGKKAAGGAAGGSRKTASSATRLARGGDKAKGRAQIEGLESKARRVQAKATGAGAGAAKAKGWKI
ncbi:hypothetical protein JCM10207_006830 [Rhodosporidiobolus poonsookiae]